MKWIRDARVWLCALLALALVGGAAMAEAGDDPVAVRVGAFSYTRSMLQQSLTLAATQADDWSDDLAAAKTAYDEAAEALNEAQNDYREALSAATLPLVRDTVDEIKGQYEAASTLSRW